MYDDDAGDEASPLLRFDSLFSSSSPGVKSPLRERVESYMFTGKLTLFPVVAFLSFGGAAFLIAHTRHHMKKHDVAVTESSVVIKSIIGVALILVAFGCLVTLLRFLVVKVVFTFKGSHLIVTKVGVLRSSSLKFYIPDVSLHYFRSHYDEASAWLTLVVAEAGVYYRICSWRGKGDQKARFLEFFATLEGALAAFQGRPDDVEGVVGPFGAGGDGAGKVFVSSEEVTLLHPFANRLRDLAAQRSGGSSSASSLSTRQIQKLQSYDTLAHVVDLDRFFNHFDDPPPKERE